MSLVKISVENLETRDPKLHEIDKTKSLEDNIKSVCELFGKPTPTSAYGLKLISTNDGKYIDCYVSEDNFNDIKDGYFLKLAYSIKHCVNEIFNNINSPYKEYRDRGFEDLYRLSIEPELIKELVKTNRHLELIDYFIHSELEEKETMSCLIAIVHLFQKNFITDISSEFLQKVLLILKSEATAEQTKYALSVIHKILLHRDQKFFKWKEETLKQLPISELTPFIWSEEYPDLQYGALLVINSLIRCCKGEKRQQLIKKISVKSTRETIYKHIIVPNKIDKLMAHELYVFQTYLLSLFAESLNTTINVENKDQYNLREFEIHNEEEKSHRMTVVMDFEDTNFSRIKNSSNENLLEENPIRISLASMQSEESQVSERVPSYAMSDSSDCVDVEISILSLEALRHYKNYHYNNFFQSQVEEKVYQPGIFATSERIMKLLAKLLHIGQEPDKTSQFYQPIIFCCSSKTSFLFEFFSRTMWLLSKTRREMKAVTIQDYEKVLRVLERQVKIVLGEKPMDFKLLTQKMINVSYETVREQWQKEKDEEINVILETNPSVQVLKAYYREQNTKAVFKQRMNFILKGTLFPKILENKKLSGNFVAKVSINMRELIVYDYNPNTKLKGDIKSYPISNITHVITGRACPHVVNNIVREVYKAFSVIVDNSDYINFIAPDKKTTAYWTDALNLLLNKTQLSDYYEKELNQLVKMDLMLHLIELQNVTIPKKAPPIPPNPFNVRPPVPPKPAQIPKHF